MSTLQPMDARSRQRGFTIIEALVAFLVMSLGLLAFSRIQVTLRLNADISKQRSEAVRLAQEKIEDLRSFSQLTAAVNVATFDGTIVTASESNVKGSNTNTVFSRVSTVTVEPAGATAADVLAKKIIVAVSWTDRTGAAQSVNLSTIISRTDPGLATQVSLPAVSNPVRNPFNRNVRIPTTAIDLGGGRSGFTPPGANFYYVFNNTDASVFQKCTGALSSEAYNQNKNDTSVCQSAPGYFLSGFVSFDLANKINLVENGGLRPADPSSTVCDFYKDAQNTGLITATPPALSVASASPHLWGSDNFTMPERFYALAVSLESSNPTNTQSGISTTPSITLDLKTSLAANNNKLQKVFFQSGKTVTLAAVGGTTISWAGNGTSTVTGSPSGTGAVAVVDNDKGTATLTITPPSLSLFTTYTLTIPVGALGFYKSGPGSTNVLMETNEQELKVEFTTAGETPTLVSTTPGTNTQLISLGSNIELNFSMAMAAGSGVISLYRQQGNGNNFDLVETFTLPGASNVTFSGTKVILNPIADLNAGSNYYITVSSGALKAAPSAGSATYPGFSDKDTLKFTTAAGSATVCPTSQSAVNFLDFSFANFSGNQTGSSWACYSDALSAVVNSATRFVTYFCVITGSPSSTSAAGFRWNGSLKLLGPTGWLSGSTAQYKVCRYFDFDGDGVVPNDQHPDPYSSVAQSLTDQNFLVIDKDAQGGCPSQTLDIGSGQGYVSIYFKTTQIQP